MKVGDYVITKDRLHIGEIYNINDFREQSMMYAIDFPKQDDFIFMGEDNFKSSPNITDLIELGDLVRLFMEEDIDKEDTNIFEVVAINDDKKEIGVFTGNFEIEFFPVENLRGIVTKEQFSQMEYMIGE